MVSPDYAPLVTVYITSHNYGRFVEQAIKSVLGQTMQDFELIIIDDGSTDNSRDIIELFSSHEKVIPIFQHNKGLNVTNNIAMRAARGKYVVRLDADDWMDGHMLEVLSNLLERNPDVGLVFPDYYNVDLEGNIIEQVRRHDFDDVTLHDQPAHGACTMIRRQCLRELGGYDESFTCQDGYDLWVRFIENYGVQNVNLPLFYYRQHGSSLTRNEERILATRAEILKRHAQHKDRHIRTIAIVTVRGPSHDPVSSALNILGGKPLINWTLDSALDADRVSDVVLSTPDKDLLGLIDETYGDRIIGIERDPKLALPNTFIEDTLLDALDQYEENHQPPEAIMNLSIETPFRGSRQIDAAVDVMELFETDSVIGVRPETDVMYKHDGAGLIPVQQVSDLRLEREEIFREVGGTRLISVDYFRKVRRVTGGRVGHVVMDPRASLCIRSRYEWELAELMAGQTTADG